ncbi:MAG: formate dehydrogenase accessory sulfurtransferase FdhD [Aestuariivirga sp.]|uniref:formate dehydrogenase accessory sulfurtransferase FdhD n=1 Tax=Aestuariivirga sp. TaxID=2650926 RepID=UPI0025C6192E|nr:formate dehydrogenase accessory sulfurtransferase FdhD [Aestuariivirga sp.]MCA3561506.1 formate dehydrogenase accessory sulfurtransferase FdhD [Aestuariivirga sp.]
MAAAASVPAKGILHTLAGDEETVWQVPEEVPLAVQFNSQNYAVMMGTPADFEDFAVGFAVAEGIIAKASDVTAVLVLPAGQGYAIDLSVAEDKIDRGRMAKRSIEGRTGCGLCGIADMKDAIRMPSSALPAVDLRPQAVARAYEQLPAYQPMSRVNRTVHAAAWCSVDGEILLSREDVGRHTALDKLIGALAREGADLGQGFVLMSSRCSFELVQKCAMAGIGALATVSAPTALALSLARQARLKLAALANRGVMIFDRD